MIRYLVGETFCFVTNLSNVKNKVIMELGFSFLRDFFFIGNLLFIIIFYDYVNIPIFSSVIYDRFLCYLQAFGKEVLYI